MIVADHSRYGDFGLTGVDRAAMRKSLRTSGDQSRAAGWGISSGGGALRIHKSDGSAWGPYSEGSGGLGDRYGNEVEWETLISGNQVISGWRVTVRAPGRTSQTRDMIPGPAGAPGTIWTIEAGTPSGIDPVNVTPSAPPPSSSQPSFSPSGMSLGQKLLLGAGFLLGGFAVVKKFGKKST